MMNKAAMQAFRKANLFGWIPGLLDSTGEDLFLGDLRFQESSKANQNQDGTYHSDTVTTTMESDDSSDEEEASSSSTNNSVGSYGTARTSGSHDGELPVPSGTQKRKTGTKQNQPKRRYPRSPYSKRSRHYPDPIRITVY